MNQFKAAEGCCEEASILSREVYIPCNLPATKVMRSDRDKRDYRMCEACAHHNLKRGMIDVTSEVSVKPKD